jgi:hypothetical protein
MRRGTGISGARRKRLGFASPKTLSDALMKRSLNIRHLTLWSYVLLSVLLAALTSIAGQHEPIGAKDNGSRLGKPACVRDLIWVWGNPQMAQPGEHTLATFAQASPAQRARLLGAPNVVLAGYGLPNNDLAAETLTKQVAEFKRLVWEIAPDGESGGPPFFYADRLARLRCLVDTYPQIEGVLLDDMSTIGIDKGFKPGHIRHVRALLPDKYSAVKVWGVVYTMSLERSGINDYIHELDIINLWTWHAKDLARLEQNVAYCERLFPTKRIVLGLYLYDYGGGRRMPLDLLEQQCETALKLARAGRIQGMVFLTITNDADTVAWAANWIKKVGDQQIGSLANRPRAKR